MEIASLLGVREVLKLLDLEFSILFDDSEYGKRIVLELFPVTEGGHCRDLRDG